MDRPSSHNTALRHLLVVLAGALLLLIPGLLNQEPFLYRDTTTYYKGAETGIVRLLGDRFSLGEPALADPATVDPARNLPTVDGGALTSVDDGVVIAGRSVYYGVLVYAALWLGSLFYLAALQALIVSYVVHAFFRVLMPQALTLFLPLLALLSLATPLGYFTNLIMPDILAGAAIVIVAILLTRFAVLGLFDRVCLLAILVLALLGHSSHLLLVGLMLGLGIVLVARHGWRRLRDPALLLIASALLVGFAGEQAFNFAARQMLGSAPLRLPHLSAHLVEMGPGTEYLDEHCPEAGFAICADRAKFPIVWTNFLFNPDPRNGVFAVADAPRKRAISDEQVRFAFAVLADRPLETMGGFSLSFLEQLGRFKLDELYYDADSFQTFATRLPASEFRRVARSAAAGHGVIEDWLTGSTYLVVLASLAIIAAMQWRLWRSQRAIGGDLITASWLILFGVVANAAVCGIIASPFDRFQARVIWLVPLAALALAMAWRGQSRISAARETSPAD
ncbi:hypothetical protein [Novosphingobium aquimarinum]|uniref:hypothetical protein n=1 Tax=Novosphingobium aquimarinum TaxID=2682494 RepID=UPI0012EB0CE3|nr:hypothetical protein [Novosphingobium aquimarinum]